MSKKYSKKDPISHILDRSEMYVGSKKLKDVEEYVAIKNGDSFKIDKKLISSSPAILRIFIEILSNAIDNFERSRKSKTPCKTIKVSINKESGETIVWNDGEIIPIEIHEEEGVYNHSLIFGNLLTGSNYDDKEERLVSGKNGLGSKCLQKGTLIPLYNGKIKKIENIKVGDYLIGDDGNKRKVINTISGVGKLYEVSQPRGMTYVVNSEHILSLRMPDHKIIFWNSTKGGWSILWLDQKTKKVCSKIFRCIQTSIKCDECGIQLVSHLKRHYQRMHPNIEVQKKERKSPQVEAPDTKEVNDARIEIEKFKDTIQDDNTLDISIKEYLKMTPTMQSRFAGFKSCCVNWEKRDVKLDPYVLGLWLGDGYQNGRGFAINAEEDIEILQYLKEWGKENDANFANVPNCDVCKKNKNVIDFIPCKSCAAYSISSIEFKGQMYKAPLKNLLKMYNLLDEKFIPQEYLINDRETRLKVLAGLIDSDGHVYKERDGRRISISQGMMHERLAKDIIYLVRSLGIQCTETLMNTTWTYKGELRKGKAININISGNIEDIPTLVKRKKCSRPLKREVLNSGKLSIKKIEDGEFIGVSIDGNERFVLEDFTVTHNCTCVFSAKFTVKGADPNNKKTFEQTWTNNMKTTTEAIVKTLKSIKTGYTQVTYFPDFKQFGLKGYTDDIINLYTKYIIDTAMLTKVKVYLNDELINVNSLESYSRLYENPTEESLLIKNTHSEVLIMPSSIGEFQTVSFVNGIYTKLGGVHVDAFAEAIFRPIVEKFNKKDKPVINIKDVKQFFRLFVVSTVVNPDFEGQSKEKLESPKIEAVVKSTEINKILKWSVISELEDIIKMKDMAVLKKVERKSKSIKVEGLDRANLSDTKDSYKCSLILCEGLSAKTYAVAGIKKGVYGKAGRDYFGILSLTGKILNCRNSNPTSISKNAVITKLIQSLGLRHGTDYTDDKNYKSLSYGKVILLADADVDGIHITSLIINFFHYLFPSLLERKEPFICNMCTPIVRVFNSKGDLLFYDENRFRKFSEEQTRPFKSKYYKGLGTTKAEDVPDTFGKKMIEYNMDEGTNTSINKVFNKKFADTRKEWLEKYDPRPTFSLDDEGAVVDMKLSTYLNTETIKFSHDDCKRSIPSLYDGLKQSQRKILYAVKKRNLTYNKPSLKVAQLGGYVAEVSNYHHGEQNLYDTIVNMAQDYVGSNNIPLLYRDGMFGTRLANGSDAASARYIFTKMEILTPLIFREEDDVLLEQVCDDGDLVEPRFYIPIIPMILVNGALGIGTGWSSTIPCYNPIDVVDAVKTWIENKGQIIEEDEDGTILSLLPELYPWYRGFKGNISQINENKFISKGVLTLNKNLIKISEIPIGMAINTFKEFLEDLKDDKKIKKFDNQSSEVDIDFTITPIDGFKCDIENLKLHSYLNISNMVCFNIKDQLKKYKLDQIINDFCIVRYDYYIKRKKHILNTLESELRHLGNKARFIGEIIDGKLNIMNVDEKIIITELEKRGYDKEQGSEDGGKGYNYLLTLHIRTFTRDKVKKLKDDIASCQLKIDGIRSTTEYKMWINDLGEFEVAYKKWVNEPEKSKKPKKK